MNKLDKNIISKVSKSRLRTWLKILKTSNLIEKQIKEKLRDEHNTTSVSYTHLTLPTTPYV